MNMQIFYSPESKKEMFFLPAEESYHCIKVLRYKKNDTVVVSNGKGFMSKSIIIDDNPCQVMLKISEIIKDVLMPENNFHIAISLLKNMSRFEFFIEKATELRVLKITPLICARTYKTHIKTERLKKIMIESMKQSISEFLPELNVCKTFEEFIKISAPQNSKYIAVSSQQNEVTIDDAINSNTVIMIGPEGDFTYDEVCLAKQHGFKTLDLGSSRLRTETAGIFVAASMYYKHLKS